MDRLVTLLEQLRINTVAQLVAKTRGDVAALALERRSLEVEVKELITQLGEDARWEVAGYEAWSDDLMALLLKSQRGRSRLAA